MDQNNQQFIKAAVITVIIAGALGALTILIGEGSAAIAKLFGISLALLIYGIFATICMVVTNKPAFRTVGTAGMIIPLIGFLVTVILIIGELLDQTIYQLAGALFVLSMGLAHICLLFHINLQNKHAQTARTTAVIAISLFTFVLVIRIFDSFPGLMMFGVDGAIMKFVFSAFIIDLSASLLVPLCNRLQVNNTIHLDLADETPAPPPPVEQTPPSTP